MWKNVRKTWKVSSVILYLTYSFGWHSKTNLKSSKIYYYYYRTFYVRVYYYNRPSWRWYYNIFVRLLLLLLLLRLGIGCRGLLQQLYRTDYISDSRASDHRKIKKKFITFEYETKKSINYLFAPIKWLIFFFFL